MNDLTEPLPENTAAPYYTISTLKLVVLSVVTLGLFNCVWFYKNWKVYAAKSKEDISPFWRSLFYGVTCFSLFGSIKSEFDLHGMDFRANPAFLGAMVMASGALSRIHGPLFLLCFVNIVPLVMVNNRLIQFNKAILGMAITDERISIPQWAVIIFGFTLLSFAIVGLMAVQG